MDDEGEALADRYRLTPVMYRDPVDGSPEACVPWSIVRDALMAAEANGALDAAAYAEGIHKTLAPRSQPHTRATWAFWVIRDYARRLKIMPGSERPQP